MFSKTTNAFPAAVALSATGSTMKLSISTSRPDRLSWWTKVTRLIAEWRIRARSRNELMNLSDRTLLDIGVPRFDAKFEASKPFWMA